MTITKDIIELLECADLNSHIISIENGRKGGNNRTYRVTTVDGRFIVKEYFKEKCDARDRLGAEFAFLQYATKIVPQSVPIPFAKNNELGLALYECVEGEPFNINDISESEVHQAIAFFVALNAEKNKQVDLPNASEACFSIAAHLELVERRINALKQIKNDTAEDNSGLKLINKLDQYWQVLLEKIHFQKMNLSISLEEQDKCISPSDFGFHNALIKPNGTLCFLDFEYAGWDDPAKMTGDFFSQLAIPVPENYFDTFVKAVMAPFENPADLIKRAYILRAVYQVKWCCIALNIFIPEHLKRRQFANPNLNVQKLKHEQLGKAANMLKKMENMNG